MVDDKDKMVAVKDVVAVHQVVKLTPIFIPVGTQTEMKQPPLTPLTLTYDDSVVSNKAGLHSMPTYDDNVVNDEILVVCGSKISLNFCKDCRIFCEVEWEIKVDG